MNKLEFPETTTPGMLFNDFLNGHPILDIYGVDALRTEQQENVTVLFMSDDSVIRMSSFPEEPYWVSCEVHDKEAALELNWFIFGHLRWCVITENVRMCSHPTEILLTVEKHPEGFYTYRLSLDIQPY